MTISWTEKRANEEVLLIVGENKCLLSTMENRRGKTLGNLDSEHNNFIKNMIEGKIVNLKVSEDNKQLKEAVTQKK